MDNMQKTILEMASKMGIEESGKDYSTFEYEDGTIVKITKDNIGELLTGLIERPEENNMNKINLPKFDKEFANKFEKDQNELRAKGIMAVIGELIDNAPKGDLDKLRQGNRITLKFTDEQHDTIQEFFNDYSDIQKIIKQNFKELGYGISYGYHHNWLILEGIKK